MLLQVVDQIYVAASRLSPLAHNPALCKAKNDFLQEFILEMECILPQSLPKTPP